ncbi:MAG: hypothetical protein ACK553_11270, partial [Planctomycetota bacterium]
MPGFDGNRNLSGFVRMLIDVGLNPCGERRQVLSDLLVRRGEIRSVLGLVVRHSNHVLLLHKVLASDFGHA